MAGWVNLKKLTDLRLRESQALLKSRCPSGSYYLAGYAVEAALKVCIVKQFKPFTMPDRETVSKAYTHNFEHLIRLAGIEADHHQELKSSVNYRANWSTVKDWSPDARYAATEQLVARDFLAALTDTTDGVIPWIKRHW